MRPRLVSAVRALVIAAGAGVLVASALCLRREDWPVYATFALLVGALLPFYVEVLPSLVLPMPSLAVTLAFLYIGGLPILLIYNVSYNVVFALLYLARRAVPEPWRSRIPYPVGGGGEVFALPSMLTPGERSVAAGEHSVFSLGLATRLLIVHLLAPGGRPAAHPGTMAVAELGGYACWGVLSALPILRFRTALSPRSLRPLDGVYHDLGLIMIVALTPLIFLIAQGYEASGLPGAVAWSLFALGLHPMLRQLNGRRMTVERQNQRLEALNRALEHRERLSAIGKMSSVVSHQMLQQLGVIGLHADLIRNAADPDPAALAAQARTNAAAIEDALGDVNRVLTDLLVFSRDLRLNLYDHAVASVVAECAEECGAAAALRGVSLRITCPDDVHATLDKLKVKQALANVVRNAIDASSAGGEVVVQAGVRDGWIEVAVSDDGPGVPEADRDAVFTPFFTTKEQGTGLGLAIAREFVEAHGGRLALDGRRGRGATFVLRLPLRRG